MFQISPGSKNLKVPLAVRVASWSNAIAQHLPHLEANLGVRWRMRGVASGITDSLGDSSHTGMPFSLW